MKRKKYTPLAALAGLALAAGSAHGALVVYEPFDYSTGALAGKGPATGLTGTWSSSGSNQQSVVSPGLVFEGLSTTGNLVRRTAAPGGAESSVALSTMSITSLTADNSTIYFSMLLRNDRFSVSNENFAFTIGNGPLNVVADKNLPNITGGDGFGVSMNGNNPNDNTIDIFGYQVVGGTASLSEGKIDNDTSVNTFFITGRIEWGESGVGHTMSLFNITDVNAALPTAFATMTADFDQTTFDTLAMSSNQVATIDEIRFGTTLESVGVIPEPSTALLGSLGMLFLLRRRR